MTQNTAKPTSTGSASKRLVTRAVWAAKLRKLAKESSLRGDDPFKDSAVVNLTPTQLEFVRQDVASPDTSVNTIGGALILDGPTDADALRKAVNIVRKNNDGMRIRFVEMGGTLRQYAAAFTPLTTSLLTFEKESELEAYCDRRMGEPYGEIKDKDLNSEIDIFQLADGRGGVVLREHHLRQDAAAVGLFVADVLDVYEQMKSGHQGYEGAITSFIEYARTAAGVGSIGVGTTDQVDAASTRSTFILSQERTLQLKRFCQTLGTKSKLRIRPSKVFELANAIYIGIANNRAQKVTLHNLATGRKRGTSDDFTIGLFMTSRPVGVFLDWNSTVADNLIDAKKRAKGTLGEPPYVSESDSAYRIDVSFRVNPEGLKSLIKTPFHLYEPPRRYSPVPLFLSIDDMSETGQYTLMYDYWNSTYTSDQIEDRHATVMKVLDLMMSHPEMTLAELSDTLGWSDDQARRD